jgi:hypothetical protein
LPEVGRLGERILGDCHQTLEAFIEIILGKMMNIILKGIGDEAITNPNPRFTLVMKPSIFSKEGDHGVIKVFVVGELDVAADIPGKALIINEGGREPPWASALIA